MSKTILRKNNINKPDHELSAAPLASTSAMKITRCISVFIVKEKVALLHNIILIKYIINMNYSTPYLFLTPVSILLYN